ncbi:MAG: bifunctional precorrin-2 dehydrogenase/sirohydrochlorin ferrochelatase [Filifactor alocis]|nr:bifunctional precorrin-2 dehydrogenase/sirohydrochlorin ferrochelatase [Filifactor alocis]
MIRYYPLYMDIQEKTFLVIGGGRVACRKIRSLLRSQVSLLVVSKEFSKELREIGDERLMLYQMSAEEFFEKHGDLLDKVDFALLATDDREVNRSLAKRMKELRILTLVADEKEESDFIMPSVIEKEMLRIAISTEGGSPVISKMIKARIEEVLSDIDFEKLRYIEEVRKVLVEASKRGDKKDVAGICEDLLKANKTEVETYLKRIKGEEVWK